MRTVLRLTWFAKQEQVTKPGVEENPELPARSRRVQHNGKARSGRSHQSKKSDWALGDASTSKWR